MSQTNREPGFYWVRTHEWFIAEWHNDRWWLSFANFPGDKINEIDERQIVREEPNDPEVVKELEKMIDKRCMAGEIGVNTSRKMLRVIHPEWSKGGHIPATVSYRVCEEPSK